MRTIIAISSLIGLSAGWSAAHACTCPPLPSAADQAEEFDLIFIGAPTESINLTPKNPSAADDPPPPPTADRYETHFSVTRVLKGDEMSTVKISHTERNPLSCGIDYYGDGPRLILAQGSEERGFSTWFCSIPQFSIEAFDAALEPPED